MISCIKKCLFVFLGTFLFVDKIYACGDYSQKLDQMLSEEWCLNQAALLCEMSYYREEDRNYDENHHSLERNFRFDNIRRFGDLPDGGIKADWTDRDDNVVHYVAFAGTPMNQLTENLNITGVRLRDIPLNPFTSLHSSSRLFADDMIVNKNVVDHYLENPLNPSRPQSYPMILCGHSRGRAIADLATLHCGETYGTYKNLATITFGQVYTFSDPLANYINRSYPHTLKVAHDGDVGPSLRNGLEVVVDGRYSGKYAASGNWRKFDRYSRWIHQNHSMESYKETARRAMHDDMIDKYVIHQCERLLRL